MTDLFKPQNFQEECAALAEKLRFQIQYAIQVTMKNREISRKSLAKKAGCSAANISQLLRDDANLRIETIAKVFCALGEQIEFRSSALEGKDESIFAKRVADLLPIVDKLQDSIDALEQRVKTYQMRPPKQRILSIVELAEIETQFTPANDELIGHLTKTSPVRTRTEKRWVNA